MEQNLFLANSKFFVQKMSSLVVNFNQLVDLAVNPSLGTINTSLLHSLIHIIINQLQLSSSFIEFHGAGSASIENYIVTNQNCCEIQINEFQVTQETDEITGSIFEKRREIKGKKIKIDESAKLFTVRNVETDCKHPIAYPLNPIQVLSIEKIQEHQTNSVHDIIANVMPTDEKLINEENKGNPLKTMFDLINFSKRIDALEIGIRKLADIFKKAQCEIEQVNSVEKEIDPLITSLVHKVDGLSKKIENFQCKCNDNFFEENLLSVFRKKVSQDLSPLQLEMKTLEMNYKTAFEMNQQRMTQFIEKVCDRLDSIKNDLLTSMKEVQEMMDTKLDKFFVPELKDYLQEKIHSLDEKIENLSCKKNLAAGVVKKIFKDLNCISCGENVIQADARNPAQSMLTRSDAENHPRHNNISEFQLLELPTRLCGGNHTITTPRERIFQSESCQN